MMWFPEISLSPPQMGFHFLPLHSSRNSSLASYFPLKILAFETPHPLGICSEHPWGGYGHILQPHMVIDRLKTKP